MNQVAIRGKYLHDELRWEVNACRERTLAELGVGINHCQDALGGIESSDLDNVAP